MSTTTAAVQPVVAAASPNGGNGPREPSWRVSERTREQIKTVLATWALLGLVGATVLIAVGPFAESWRRTALEAFAVIVASFLPGWLFVRFVRGRLEIVREEFVLNLHRLGIDHPGALPEPPRNSIYYDDWQEKRSKPREDGREEPTIYEQKFDAYYGKYPLAWEAEESRGAEAAPLKGFAPVCVATLAFAAGWTWIVVGDGYVADPKGEIFDALRFAFLGAYAFSLQVLVRRFFQDDLKTNAYISATVRVVLALVAAALFHVLPQTAGIDARWHAALAFAVGFLPSAIVVLLQQVGNRLFARVGGATFKVRYPLGEIDGLDLWYEVRLFEEGIEDMENLATANLVDVLLRTRVPATRLVDWVDQAILYIHLLPERDGGGEQRDRFRRLSLRTATDLLAVIDPPKQATVTIDPEDRERLLAWAVFDATPPPGVKLVAAYVNALRTDTNLYYVAKWRDKWWGPNEGESGGGGNDHGNGAVKPVKAVKG